VRAARGAPLLADSQRMALPASRLAGLASRQWRLLKPGCRCSHQSVGAISDVALRIGKTSGIRRFDPRSDLASVVELTEEAFGAWLGPDGEAVVSEWRRAARLGTLLWPLYWSGSADYVQGFVWVVDGRIVGNVSLRRALEPGGFLIGNVAVHPYWQRRGIGRALMQRALEEAATRQGQWVGLEVRDGNEVARSLYRGLGFREVGWPLQMLRSPRKWCCVHPPDCPGLRRGRRSDCRALLGLATDVLSAEQKALAAVRAGDFRPTRFAWFDFLVSGVRDTWWVVQERRLVQAAVRATQVRGQRPDRLQVLIDPKGARGYESALVTAGLGSLPKLGGKMVETWLPVPDEDWVVCLIEALREAGFREWRRLVQMRLDMR
jgi:ribosomal protein S18 acetylase RimI-like enzyme